MVSSKNFAIRKRETIGYIKSILENECPGKVSCADIIGLAAKESVSFSGGPHIQIPLGRKDSTTSSYQQADASLPPQGIKVHELIHTFASKGMNLEESIAIIGNGLNNLSTPTSMFKITVKFRKHKFSLSFNQ